MILASGPSLGHCRSPCKPRGLTRARALSARFQRTYCLSQATSGASIRERNTYLAQDIQYVRRIGNGCIYSFVAGHRWRRRSAVDLLAQDW